jgi:hypothetical protein
MPIKDILKSFRKYQKTNPKKRAKYMLSFEEQMIYRTTKTENPETTLRMVRQVLRKFPSV